PIGKLEQVAGWRALAPQLTDACAGPAALKERQRRRATRHPQNEIDGEAFRQRQCDDAVGIRIVADGAGKADAQPGAGEINSGIETVTGARRGEGAIRAAAQLDQCLPDADDAWCVLTHPRTLSGRATIGRLAG